MASCLMRGLMSCGLMLSWILCAGEQLAAADSDTEIVRRINQLVRQAWVDNEVQPSVRSTDGEFARRVSLDIVGRIPRYEQLLEFTASEEPQKRQAFVEQLLDDTAYVRNWTSLWGNLLIGRGNGRADLDRWLRRALARNMPYRDFVRELVAAEGTNRENGAVSFLARHLNNDAVPATSVTARVFLGMQVQCTQCHNHPFNDWKQSQFWGMNAFFRGTARGNAGERGQFRLVDQPSTDVVYFEKRSGLMQATVRQFVDGTRVPMNATAKPRRQLAELIVDEATPYLSRAIVNRMWGHFFGYGFTRPVDDMGPHNPPSHPELLDYLVDQFAQAGFDVKRLIRWITASEAYSLTSRFGPGNTIDNPDAGETPLFSRMYLKQFRAEQLYDSLIVATAADRAGRSAEAAESQRRAWLQQFVQTFGTDENDQRTNFNGTIPQALVLMNGSLVDSAVNGGPGGFLQRVLDAQDGDLNKKNPPRRSASRRSASKSKTPRMPAKIEALFLAALARKPSANELEAIDLVFQEAENRDPVEGLRNVFWAILNSNEFITNH